MNPGAAADLRARRLTLIVPDLGALWREGAGNAALLARMAGRGRPFRLTTDCPHLEILSGGRPLPGAGLISRLGEVPEDSEGDWLRCDPVALVPDLTRVWFARAQLPTLPTAPRSAMQAALASLFAAEGMTFALTAAGRGYLRLAAPPRERFVAPWRAQGAALDAVMPSGPDAARWHQLLNTSQMVLHALPGLQALPPDLRPTSIWFWGAGTRVASLHLQEKVCLVGDDPMLAGSARWLGLEPLAKMPDAGDGHVLAHWSPDPAQPAADNLAALEEAWLAPLWSAMKRGRLTSLQIADYNGGFSLGRLDALRFWCAPAPTPEPGYRT